MASRGLQAFSLTFLLFLYCILGGWLFLRIEPESFEHSWATSSHFAVVTVTTVGYGDYVVKSSFARLLLFVYAHVGIVLAAVTTNSISIAVQERFLILQGPRNSLLRNWKVWLNRNPVILFSLLYFILLFLGTSILSFTVDVRPSDFQSHGVQNKKKLWGWDKAFYYSWVTLTTIGYGDEVQEASVGRILTAVYGVIGFSFLGIILKRTSKFVERMFRKSDSAVLSDPMKEKVRQITEILKQVKNPLEVQRILRALKHEELTTEFIPEVHV
eukprot:TRINITY_DN2603_c0_g1_i7.p1 TRINITY_DN2603_c0_g1~~TRINITY_DN2603_c0_g1_i7.p1  ORF type:complete len:271 (-),score=26.05 TRINITY_DN2603_c0_g1_i7:145-957(-)